MVNINISLTEEAYNYLKMLKGNEKSFSDVVLEIKHDKKSERGTARSLLKYAGCLKNLDTKKFDKIREDLNKSFEKRQEEIFNDRN